ncbi:MAG: Ig-like domain-containing protein, partial [Fimbriimonadales bacterium]|nr:Ig-like domain-containing protein [Fimbriimonadales bacterium]
DFYYNAATGEGQRGMAGGAGLNVIGLLVQVTGTVTQAAPDHFLLADGDGRAVKVWLTPGMVAPPVGSLARATGVVSPQRIGNELYPTIRIRRPEDVQAPLETVAIQSPNTVVRGGWNQFTLGGVPANPNPLSVLGNFNTGDGLANRLRRFDPLAQEWLSWNPANPSAFGGLLVGEGYQLQSTVNAPIQFEGAPFTAIDIWLSLPRRGFTVVGHPFDAPVPWETVKVADGLQAMNMFTAARVQSPPWLESRATYLDNLSQTTRTLGLPTDNPDSVLMEPWLGYRVESFRDQLALIVSNRAPIANDDEIITEVGTPIEALVLENDRSPTNRTLRIANWTQGQHGSVTRLSESVLVYTPNSGFAGLDSFTYTVEDSDGFRATATVYVCVGRVTLTGIVRLGEQVDNLASRAVRVQVGRGTVQTLTLQGAGREGTFTLRIPAFGEYVVKVKPQGALQQTVTVRPEGSDITVRFDGAGAGLPLGDANGDNFIDDADLLEVLFQFGQSGANLAADLNGDSTVDDADLLIVLFNFGLYGNP